MRAIDADKLKEKIIAFRLKNEGSNVIYNTALGKVIKAIDEQPTIDDWIPVSERLPENDEDVICTRLEDYGDKTNIFVAIGGYFCGGWHFRIDEYRIKMPKYSVVTAWQPLPEPYEGENNEI